MKAIYFVELENGEKRYKTDSFWSKSKDFTHAKVHDDSNYDKERFFISLCGGFRPWNTDELNEQDYESIQKYQNSLYGYQTILSDFSEYLLPSDALLSEPHYLKRIDTISKKGEVEFTDTKVIFRDKKIDDIIN